MQEDYYAAVKNNVVVIEIIVKAVRFITREVDFYKIMIHCLTSSKIGFVGSMRSFKHFMNRLNAICNKLRQ